MSIWSRILMFLKIKTSSALDKAEDPRQVLDYAYSQQQDLLRTVKRGLIEVATTKKQLEAQVKKQRGQVPRLEDQARRALDTGREDLARLVLQRKHSILSELGSLEAQFDEVAEEEQRLIITERELALRIEDFRNRSEVASARYTAAEAQVRIHESLTGVSGELGELTMALGRAEEKTKRMLARASAIDSLVGDGALEPMIVEGDIVERELLQLTAASAVEDELAALKAESAQASLPPPDEIVAS